MRTIDIARRMAELDQKEDAQKAYLLALQEAEGKNPEEEMESASYIFFSEGDYEVAYTTFVSLYNRGCFQAELMDLLTQAFYLPNVEEQKKRYQNNCWFLSHYPYFFRDDFPVFEELPILFFPFNDQGFVPFVKEKKRFSPYVNFNDPVIDRYFFRDLEKPVLAADVYSQYHLEYLNDNVRKSEWVGRENHIYLHYTNWVTFCSYLQCLDFQELLRDEKLIFLFEDEIEQYPIDFKERFGIDYSQYPVKPVEVREVKRLIWHAQLSAHNGGDFFNEIFYGHPNLLTYESVLFSHIEDEVKQARETLRNIKNGEKYSLLILQMAQLKDLSEKDLLVGIYLSNSRSSKNFDRNSRIAPALFFQPHFYNIHYELRYNDETNYTELFSKEVEKILQTPMLREFKYIKTFFPMRRITTSYAASMRFMLDGLNPQSLSNEKKLMPDLFMQRFLNRSYLIDREERMFRDSVLVRFEDAKLNPKATFTALAEFLDVPYTESMTYCSSWKGINPESMKGNVRGFDPETVYRTYDEYGSDAERAFLEYFLRDAYGAYGYDFHYYHGETVDQAWIEEQLKHFDAIDYYIQKTWKEWICKTEIHSKNEETEQAIKSLVEKLSKFLPAFHKNRLHAAQILLHGLHFVNQNGQPLHMMKLLQLDPALLEQPLYH